MDGLKYKSDSFVIFNRWIFKFKNDKDVNVT